MREIDAHAVILGGEEAVEDGSGLFCEMPGPASRMAKSTMPPWSGRRVDVDPSLGSATPARFAWTAPSRRFDDHLLQLDLVAKDLGQGAAESAPTGRDRPGIRFRGETNSSASSTTSFWSRQGALEAQPPRFHAPRMRWTMSLACRAFLDDRVVSWPTLARFGSSRDSAAQAGLGVRWTIAESGWLTSCAIEVASSPRYQR